MNGVWLTAFVEAVMDALKDYVPAGGTVHFEMDLGREYNETENKNYILPKKDDCDNHRIQFDAVMPEDKSMLGG